MTRFYLPNWLKAATVALLLAACATPVPIKQVLDNPRQYADRTVTVSGKVDEVFSLFVVKYFTVDDGTGTIGVITNRPLPAKGETVKVTGTVKEAFSLGDQTLTVLVERSGGNDPTPARDPNRR